MVNDALLPSSTSRESKRESLFRSPDIAVLWLILFGFGGGLFALYYSNIGYIPDIKWEDSVVYLGALTIAGAFLFILYFALLFIPGWMWSEFLIFDKKSRCLLCDEERKGVFTPRRMKILVAVGIPFGVFQLVVHFLLDAFTQLEWPWDWVVFSIGVAAALVLSSWMMRKIVLRSSPVTASSVDSRVETPRKPTLTRLKEWALAALKRFWSSENLPFENVAFFGLSFLASVFSLVIFRYSFDSESSKSMHVVCTLMVTAINLFVAISCKTKPQKSFAVMAGAALLLLVLGDVLVTGHEAKLSARIMSRFGIGYSHPVTLLLNDDGVDIIERYDKEYGIEVVEDATGGKRVKNLEILSRLGSEYFLRVPATDRSFSFPKSGIVSWAFETTGTALPAPAPPTVLGAARRDPAVPEIVPVKGPPAN